MVRKGGQEGWSGRVVRKGGVGTSLRTMIFKASFIHELQSVL